MTENEVYLIKQRLRNVTTINELINILQNHYDCEAQISTLKRLAIANYGYMFVSGLPEKSIKAVDGRP